MRGEVLRQGYTPSQFLPSVAKALIQKYKASSVLDPFAGWGDRLVGFLASDAMQYYGVDNNPALLFGYKQAHQQYAPDKQVRCICADSRDESSWEHAPASDLVLTSPPYAHYEQYRFCRPPAGEVSDWTREFLIPILRLSCSRLRVGGRLILHLNNVKIRRTILYLIDEAIRQIDWLSFEGGIGLFGKARNIKHAEPLLIWRKDA